MPFILVAIVLILFSQSFATDLGVHGAVFGIAEKNLLEDLRDRLKLISQEEFDSINEKLKNRCIQTCKQPKALNLPSAKSSRIFYFDPTYIASRDVKDKEGNFIVKKGSIYNSLEVFTLNEPLLFFDGSDPDQLNWARTEQGRWIFTNGSPIEVEKTENRPIFFDQFGYLVAKLGIKAVPAKVSQEKYRLKIEEISLGDHS